MAALDSTPRCTQCHVVPNATSQRGTSVDLNCDLGESFGRYTLGNDAAMLDVVSSANIACGLHAGDPVVMQRTVDLALARGVAIGAHPGYPDLQGFGRRNVEMDLGELEAVILYQLGALAAFVRSAGGRLAHVKPHGALYNTAARNPAVAEAVARAVVRFDPRLTVVTLPESELAEVASEHGLTVAAEGFADRAYQDDGSLLPRDQPNAVIHDPEEAARRAVQMTTLGTVEAAGGRTIALHVDTLCVHGDTANAPEIVRLLRNRLEAAGVTISGLAP